MNLLLALTSLFVAWFLVLTIPGPNFIAVTQYAISVSRQTGVLIALGVSAGAATWATASLIGISAIFEKTLWLYQLIKVMGGCYLIFMGLKIIVSRINPPPASDPVAPLQKMAVNPSAFRIGLFTSYANPKTAVFFTSLFVALFPLQAPGWFYAVTICMVFIASTIWYSLVAYLFSTTRVQTIYTKFRTVLDKITGSIFIFWGIRLALSKT